MAVLGDLSIPYRYGACSLISQDDALTLRERDWKEQSRLMFEAREPEEMSRGIWLTEESG